MRTKTYTSSNLAPVACVGTNIHICIYIFVYFLLIDKQMYTILTTNWYLLYKACLQLIRQLIVVIFGFVVCTDVVIVSLFAKHFPIPFPILL